MQHKHAHVYNYVVYLLYIDFQGIFSPELMDSQIIALYHNMFALDFSEICLFTFCKAFTLKDERLRVRCGPRNFNGNVS